MGFRSNGRVQTIGHVSAVHVEVLCSVGDDLILGQIGNLGYLLSVDALLRSFSEFARNVA